MGGSFHFDLLDNLIEILESGQVFLTQRTLNEMVLNQLLFGFVQLTIQKATQKFPNLTTPLIHQRRPPSIYA